MNDYVDLAFKFIGVPYVYGGNNPITGMDCSGLVCECLRSFGLIGRPDQSAASLYSNLLAAGWVSGIGRGAILFFGSASGAITHVAIAINSNLMIEAGGGDRETISVKEAAKVGAYTRIRPIKNRKDFYASLILGEK